MLQAFGDWKTASGVSYRNTAEERQRYANFVANMLDIARINDREMQGAHGFWVRWVLLGAALPVAASLQHLHAPLAGWNGCPSHAHSEIGPVQPLHAQRAHLRWCVKEGCNFRVSMCAQAAPNKFSDLTFPEFSQKFLMQPGAFNPVAAATASAAGQGMESAAPRLGRMMMGAISYEDSLRRLMQVGRPALTGCSCGCSQLLQSSRCSLCGWCTVSTGSRPPKTLRNSDRDRLRCSARFPTAGGGAGTSALCELAAGFKGLACQGAGQLRRLLGIVSPARVATDNFYHVL
jgi:hypothetical protein